MSDQFKKIIFSSIPLATFLSFSSFSNTVLPLSPDGVTLKLAQGNIYAAQQVSSYASSYADRKVEGWLTDWLATDQGVTEISVTGITDSHPLWNMLLLRPFYESQDLRDNAFIQGSLLYDGDRTTLNLGTGYRRLLNENRVLLGVNMFYDHEFPFDHQRMSLGGEIRTSVGELNTNWYRGLSDWKPVDNNLSEKALGGYDAEMAVALPYLPSAHLRAKRFRWDAPLGHRDIKGTTYSLTGALLPGLAIEAGYTDYRAMQSSRFLKVTYSVGQNASKSASAPRLIDVPYRFDSMEERRFDKVRRENRIVKAVQSQTFNVTVSGY